MPNLARRSICSRGLIAVLFALAVTVAGCSKSEPARPSGDVAVGKVRGPDVVLVLIDTLRCDFTSLGVDGRGHTPFLAGLGQSSVVFENAYSPAPWTLPSVASIVSGLHLAEHGVANEKKQLEERVPTLAERLQSVGYRTMSIYRNPFAGPMCSLDRGFELSHHSKNQTGREELAAALTEYLTEEPLLLYIHNTEPHDPQALAVNRGRSASEQTREFSEWYASRVDGYRMSTRVGFQRRPSNSGTDFDELQQRFLDELIPRQAEAYSIYAAAVEEADDRVRQIVQELKDRGRWEDTLFVLMADHGEEMGEHGGWQHDQSLYQELVHVPFLIRFPRDEFAGTRVEQAASMVDVLPTVIGYLGLDSGPIELSGRNWHAALAEGTQEDGPSRVVATRINTRKRFGVWAETRGECNLALRDGRFKAIWNQQLDTIELYDVEADPGETIDLSGIEQLRAEELRSLAERRWSEMRAREFATVGGGFESLDSAALESLRDLGYVGDDE